MPATPLINSLNSLRRKVRALSLAHGVSLLIASAIAALLTAGLLDYSLNLPSIPRLLIIFVAIVLVLAVLYRSLIRPALSKLTLHDIAGRLEHVFPQFDDRLRSAVNFTSGSDATGSDAMKQRTIAQAATLASTLDLNRAVSYKPVLESLGVASLACLATLLLAFLAPNYSRIAFSRLVNPFSDHPWPKRVQIDLAGNVPSRVPVGARIDVRIKLTKGDSTSRKALVFSQYGTGPVQQEYMTRSADGLYAASLDARPESSPNGQSLKIWVQAGDDEKPLPPITVVPRLAIDKVLAVVTPPPYANQPPLTIDLSTTPVLAVAGSQLQLRVAFNKPLSSATSLHIDPIIDDPKKSQPIIPSSNWSLPTPTAALGQLAVASSMRFHIRATDTDGFENAALEEFELIIRPDQSPTVQIEEPRRNEERTADASVPLQAVTEDDFGIQTASLVVDRINASNAHGPRPVGLNHWEIPLIESAHPSGPVQWARADSAPDRLRYRLNYAWELAQLQNAHLQSGDILEYSVLVTDNFSLNGQTHPPVPSGKLRIAILSQEELTNRITDEMRLAAQQIFEIKKSQARTKEETATLKDETKEKKAFDAGDQAVGERLTSQQSTVASQSRTIATKMQEIQTRLDENKSPNTELRQTAKDVQDILERAAETPMRDAVNKLTDARLPNKPADERNPSLDQAQNSQQQSADELQKALDRMGTVGNLQQMMDRVRDLLAKQQEISKETQEIAKNNLGKRPEEMSAPDRQKLDQNAAKQEALSAQTQKTLADMERSAEQIKKSDQPTAEAFKQAASTGQQQQVPQKQSKAASSAKENQQAQAQAAQKQAEIGLQMMLNDLREAERRKLEELARKLEELQQQLAHLIKRQANHNFDDLVLQGGDKLNKSDPKILADLTVLSERPKDQPQSNIPQLTAGQEQTQRNSRDIAKTTEELPNGAEPAALITKAATKMERAVVFLRDTKLDPAYDPWQTEALRALVDAKKIVDEQKAKIDQQRQQQQKEAIRAAYEKIKKDQEALDADTTRLDKSPRNPDGSLNRIDSVRLGQLPAEQSKLSDRTKAVGEDLAALGSVVYTWANNDIISTMTEVKDHLAKPDTGNSTQSEQVRIVAQLDAMIKNLAIKPLEKKMAQRGGGGGQCTPGLPSEAELRLLRALQEAVNTSTKTIAALPNKDKPALVGLGNRQGELRTVLDQLFQKSSNGQMKLGPEPDNRDQLPEEAKKEAVENQELDQQLLGDNPTADETQKSVSLIGDRMARSRQRLALNTDPGAVTQEIQKRAASDLDTLIELARKQQAQGSPQPQKPQQNAQSQPKPQTGLMVKGENQGKKPGQSKPNHGKTPANASTPPGSADTTADLSQDIKERMTEWGGITQRQRQAIIEGASETVIQKYQKLIDDYSRALAVKATENQQQ